MDRDKWLKILQTIIKTGGQCCVTDEKDCNSCGFSNVNNGKDVSCLSFVTGEDLEGEDAWYSPVNEEDIYFKKAKEALFELLLEEELRKP